MARRLVLNLLSGTEPHPIVQKEVESSLNKAVAALKKLSTFEQFAYGDQFTLADIAAIWIFPLYES